MKTLALLLLSVPSFAATPEELKHGADLVFDGLRAAAPLDPRQQRAPWPQENVEIITLDELANRLAKDPQAVEDFVEAIRKKASSIGAWPGFDALKPEDKEKLIQAIRTADKKFLLRFPTMNADELKTFIREYAKSQGPVAPEAPYPAEETLSLPGGPPAAADGSFLKSWGRGLYHGDHSAHDLAMPYGDNQRWSEFLNRLALNAPGEPPSYTLKLGDKSFTSVKGLLEHLLAAGHTVTAKDMRMFANFGGIWYEENGKWVSVVTPLFLKTGRKLPSGEDLNVPVSHTHLELNVRGPLVNADVIYFLGVGGTSMFYPMATAEKPWVSPKAVETWQGAAAVDLAERAAITRREIKAKIAKHGLPMGGYGTLGGCADVHAMIVQKPIYPQIRDPKYYNDGMTIDAWAGALPIDAASKPPELPRVLESIPVTDPAAVKIPQARAVISELRSIVR
jgi:hypothetical protein